jgi:release factor glutamine methyltransferase
MTYQQLVAKSKEEYNLDDKTIDYLVKYNLNIDESKQRLNININDKKVNSFFKKIGKLKTGLPIQYIIGTVDFYGYLFKIKPGVLIPRFETEQLVYNTLSYIKKYFGDNISIIDIGTGSGVIGITLKKEKPDLNVTMTDISEIALNVAKGNAKQLDVDVEIYKSDMLEEVTKRNQKYDVLISNPPYIADDEIIMDIVKNNEPPIALYGGKKGLKYYEELLSKAKLIIKERALIAFEIGASQGPDIVSLAKQYFKDSPYEIKKDLTGHDRMFFLFYNLFD